MQGKNVPNSKLILLLKGLYVAIESYLLTLVMNPFIFIIFYRKDSWLAYVIAYLIAVIAAYTSMYALFGQKQRKIAHQAIMVVCAMAITYLIAFVSLIIIRFTWSPWN